MRGKKRRWILLLIACIVVLMFVGCGGNKDTSGDADPSSQTETIEETAGNDDVDESEDVNDSSAGISPDFKAAMDSYEAFFDEYVEFMKKYENADSTSQMSMMSDFADYMTKYSEVLSALEKIEDEDLSDAEMAYYLEVYSRIMKKMSEVA